MKRITITQTLETGDTSTVKVKAIMGITRPEGIVTLMHDGDGEDHRLTREQYDQLCIAKELTISAGKLVTNYFRIHD